MEQRKLKEVRITPKEFASKLGHDEWKVRSVNGEKVIKEMTLILEED